MTLPRGGGHLLVRATERVAASLLRLGVTPVVHAANGGVGTWQRLGWPIEAPRP